MLPDLAKFFQVKYLFNPVPPYFEYYGTFFILLFSTLLILGLATFIFLRVKKDTTPGAYRVIHNFQNLFLTFGFLGFLYILMRFVGAAYISSRFVLVLFFAGALAWIGYIVFLLLKKVPDANKKFKKEQELAKYLPKPKKKK